MHKSNKKLFSPKQLKYLSKTRFMKAQLHIILIIFITLISFNGKAQIYDQAGNIYLNNETILTGSITYMYDQSDQIFIVDSTGLKQILHPNQVKQIVLENGKRFAGFLYSRKNPPEFLIMQALVISEKISLYAREEGGALHFYVKKDSLLQRLDYDEEVVRIEGYHYNNKKYQYRGVMKSLMADRTDLYKIIDNLKFHERDMVNLVLLYDKGNVSYFFETEGKYDPVKSWKAMVQLNRFGSYYFERTTSFSWGIDVGPQYYFTNNFRNSFKFPICYSTYHLEDEDYTHYGISFKYQYDFYRTTRSIGYISWHLFDVVHFHEVNYGKYPHTDNGVSLRFRLSPGVGYEFRMVSHFFIYAEYFHLFQINGFPPNFAIGLKYDFGSTVY